MLKMPRYLLVTLFIVQSYFGCAYAQSVTNEIQTLFTTQEERNLINKNRYKVEPKKEPRAPVKVVEEVESKKVIRREEINLSYMLAGLTVTEEGQGIAWLNGQPHEHGDTLDDGSTVVIKTKKQPLVQIKTPDGKYHSIKIGEPKEILYLKTVEE